MSEDRLRASHISTAAAAVSHSQMGEVLIVRLIVIVLNFWGGNLKNMILENWIF